jgi:hypothetical protein
MIRLIHVNGLCITAGQPTAGTHTSRMRTHVAAVQRTLTTIHRTTKLGASVLRGDRLPASQLAPVRCVIPLARTNYRDAVCCSARCHQPPPSAWYSAAVRQCCTRSAAHTGTPRLVR